MHANWVHNKEGSLAEISNKSNNNVSIKYNTIKKQKKTNIRYSILFDLQKRLYMQILCTEVFLSVSLISKEWIFLFANNVINSPLSYSVTSGFLI